MGYSGWWTVLGIVAILAAAAVVFLVIWLTRASAAEKAVPPAAPLLPTGPYDPYAALRAEYERRLATGRLGQDASSMTLSEIQQIGEAGRLTQVIARYYRPSFADHDNDPAARATDAEDSIDRARTVVRGW